MEFYGIDVSQYQKTIDWKKVKSTGKSFAFIRLGWAGWDGGINVDSMFKIHMSNAKAAGMNVGVYLYSYCKTPAAAKSAAKETLKILKAYEPIAYPVAFDIEDTSDAGVRYDKMAKSENNAIVTAFLDEVESGKYYAILYTYKSFAENYLDMAKLSKYDVWIAQYASNCTYKGSYGIWQYAGDSGACTGVTGACDLNVAYKDYAKIIEAANLNGFSAATSAPAADPEPATDELARLRARIDGLESRLAALEKNNLSA